jgi:hypothetical protein
MDSHNQRALDFVAQCARGEFLLAASAHTHLQVEKDPTLCPHPHPSAMVMLVHRIRKTLRAIRALDLARARLISEIAERLLARDPSKAMARAALFILCQLQIPRPDAMVLEARGDADSAERPCELVVLNRAAHVLQCLGAVPHQRLLQLASAVEHEHAHHHTLGQPWGSVSEQSWRTHLRWLIACRAHNSTGDTAQEGSASISRTQVARGSGNEQQEAEAKSKNMLRRLRAAFSAFAPFETADIPRMRDMHSRHT